MALRGFCCQKGEAVSNDRKRELAKSLLELAPKSLRDPAKSDVRSSAEVSTCSDFLLVCVQYTYIW